MQFPLISGLCRKLFPAWKLLLFPETVSYPTYEPPRSRLGLSPTPTTRSTRAPYLAIHRPVCLPVRRTSSRRGRSARTRWRGRRAWRSSSDRSNAAPDFGVAVHTSPCSADRRWPRWTSRPWHRCIRACLADLTASRSHPAPVGPSISVAGPLTNGTSGYTGWYRSSAPFFFFFYNALLLPRVFFFFPFLSLFLSLSLCLFLQPGKEERLRDADESEPALAVKCPVITRMTRCRLMAELSALYCRSSATVLATSSFLFQYSSFLTINLPRSIEWERSRSFEG